MRLHVNLIPALAYALVMMISHLTGMSGEAEKSSNKQQVISTTHTYTGVNLHDNCVFVSKNGQIILSNGYGSGNLQWVIPYTL
jgi:hypothetical protein